MATATETKTNGKLTEDQLKAMSRGELIEKAKELGYDRPTTAKNADLIDFIVESQKAGKPVRKESAELAEARRVYAEARVRIQKAIEASQVAMKAYRENRSDETKTAYDAAKAEHKDAVAHIKVVRTTFKNLQKKEDEKAS